METYQFYIFYCARLKIYIAPNIYIEAMKISITSKITIRAYIKNVKERDNEEQFHADKQAAA